MFMKEFGINYFSSYSATPISTVFFNIFKIYNLYVKTKVFFWKNYSIDK